MYLSNCFMCCPGHCKSGTANSVTLPWYVFTRHGAENETKLCTRINYLQYQEASLNKTSLQSGKLLAMQSVPAFFHDMAAFFLHDTPETRGWYVFTRHGAENGTKLCTCINYPQYQEASLHKTSLQSGKLLAMQSVPAFFHDMAAFFAWCSRD
jgi:hypothetical protein